VLAFRTATSTVDITRTLSGGTLGGMLQFRSEMLDPARNALGRIAAGLAEVVNEQHNAGMDLNGQLGGDFFTTGPARVLAHADNNGSGSLTVQRIDGAAGDLTTSNYVMQLTSGGWQMTRADTGAVVPMTGTGTVADPFVADGIQIVVAPGAAVGDRFLVQPTADAISGMELLISNPAEVAAAAPITTGVGAGNLGSATISAGEVINASDPNLRANATITFTSATQYMISGDPTVYTYTPGSNIDANGWRVQINGTPAAGDTFTVRDNVAGTGDNRNALRLANALNAPVLDGGTSSLGAAVGQFIGEVGVKTNQAQVSASAQKVVFEESADALSSVAGVNLDEEAANLVRYQQAYMAASQMIRVADTLFQSVLSAVSGR
jgi:flagellar hook-associated protein 1 FlgK